MGRPSALYLTPRLPWPPDDGGRIVSWQNLLALADEYDTTLISFAPSTIPAARPEIVAAKGIRVTMVPFLPPPPWLAAIRGLWGRWPYALARYRSRAFDRAIRSEIARRRPNLAYAQNLHLATYQDALDGVPFVLREQNVEFLWMERYTRTLPPSLRRAYASLQVGRLRGAEIELCRRAALVLAIQEAESDVLRDAAPGARVETLPVGIDLAARARRGPVTPPIVLLAASFEWPPNQDGALRFLREGWPRLRQRAPGALLRLAGKAPSETLRAACAACGKGVELAADVPSMAEEFARASLLLVPLWAGGGARVKIIEAAAAGLPVVSTTLGAEGLGLEAAREIEIADSPAGLADIVADLLASPARRENLAREARRVAESRWSLANVAALQSRWVREVAAPPERS